MCIRDRFNPDIYAARFNSNGVALWTTDGVPICVQLFTQFTPRIVSDNNGGAIISWQDQRSGGSFDVYAQRINSAGVTQWTANGVAVVSGSGNQAAPVVASDGTGGAIIAWYDDRTPVTGQDLYVQRVNASGVTQWTLNGVLVCNAAGDQVNPQIV